MWRHGYRLTPASWVHCDFDFRSPSASLETRSTTRVEFSRPHPAQLFAYPSQFVEDEDGSDVQTGGGTAEVVATGGAVSAIRGRSRRAATRWRRLGGHFRSRRMPPTGDQQDVCPHRLSTSTASTIPSRGRRGFAGDR